MISNAHLLWAILSLLGCGRRGRNRGGGGGSCCSSGNRGRFWDLGRKPTSLVGRIHFVLRRGGLDLGQAGVQGEMHGFDPGWELFGHHGTNWCWRRNGGKGEAGDKVVVVCGCGCGCLLAVVDRQIVVEGWVRLGRTEGGGSGRKERGGRAEASWAVGEQGEAGSPFRSGKRSKALRCSA